MLWADSWSAVLSSSWVIPVQAPDQSCKNRSGGYWFICWFSCKGFRWSSTTAKACGELSIDVSMPRIHHSSLHVVYCRVRSTRRSLACVPVAFQCCCSVFVGFPRWFFVWFFGVILSTLMESCSSTTAYREESEKGRKELGHQQVKKDPHADYIGIFGSSMNSTWLNNWNQVCIIRSTVTAVRIQSKEKISRDHSPWISAFKGMSPTSCNLGIPKLLDDGILGEKVSKFSYLEQSTSPQIPVRKFRT